MDEGLSPQEAVWYDSMRRIVQNHARTHQLGAWNLYAVVFALLTAVCQHWCAQGTDPRRLVTQIAAALHHGLTLAPPQPPVLPARVALAQTVQPDRMQATAGLVQALVTFLGEAGSAQGLTEAQACGLSVRLVRDVLVMFCDEQPRAEVDALIESVMVPGLAQALGVEPVV